MIAEGRKPLPLFGVITIISKFFGGVNMKIANSSLCFITAVLIIFNFAVDNAVISVLLLICGILLLADVAVTIVKARKKQ